MKKILVLGEIEVKRSRGWQRMRWLNSIPDSVVKNLPANAGDTNQSLGWEDTLEKKMATHSSTLVWEIPWMEEPGGLQSMRLQRVGHD